MKLGKIHMPEGCDVARIDCVGQVQPRHDKEVRDTFLNDAFLLKHGKY